MNLQKEFEEKMKTLLGSEYEEYTACYDEPRHYGLRVNTAKISVEDFLKIAPWPLEPVPWIENGFYYDGDHIQPSKHLREQGFQSGNRQVPAIQDSESFHRSYLRWDRYLFG